MRNHQPLAKGLFDCPVISIAEVARGIFLMQLQAPEIAAAVQPGQFVNVQVHADPAQAISPLLRRPFSVCQADPRAGTIAILWKIVGTGTRLLAGHRPGAVLSLLGPLGRGYDIPVPPAEVVLVAGGLGVAPMPLLAASLHAQGLRFEAQLGARTAAELWGAEELRHWGGTLALATDDGSTGHCGPVTDLLEARLQARHAHAQPTAVMVFACGPMAMLQRVAGICARFEVPAQVAIETMMGCGFGICMGCPVEPAAGAAQLGRYYLACLDGPVFCSHEIRYGSSAH